MMLAGGSVTTSDDRIARSIAARVIFAREYLGMDKQDLAKALSISPQGYGPYEKGKRTFTVPQIFVLSNILGRSVEWLLGLDTALSAEEDRLLATWRGLSPTARGLATSMLQAMAEQERKSHG
jgi:transcriptional regulator with XRE-family HTH domain